MKKLWIGSELYISKFKNKLCHVKIFFQRIDSDNLQKTRELT